MIDLWARAEGILDINNITEIELVAVNLSSGAMRTILEYVIDNSRELQTSFFNMRRQQVLPLSSHSVVSNVIHGNILGVMEMKLIFEGYRMPSMGFFIGDVDFITVVLPAEATDPVILVALFEFLRWIKGVDRSAMISLSPYQFDEEAIVAFDRLLREYFDEKHPA